MAMSGGGDGGSGLRRLGAWATRRTQPRLWVSIAGAGCLLAVSGLLVISGDARVDDNGDSGSSAPGIILFLLVVAAGYLLMHFAVETPAASAGVTAVVLGVPTLVFFLTFDESDVPPFPIEAVLGLSALAWLVSYAVGPGRGRPLLLGAGLVFAWLFVLQVIEDPATATLDEPPIISEPFGSDDPFGDSGFDDDAFGDGGVESDVMASDGGEPSWATLGITSVLFGAGYLIAARALDRRGFAGTATPFVAAGHLALPIGIALLGDELDAGGTGVAFVIAGFLVAWIGATSGRRATTVIGAIEVIVGLYLVLGDAMEESSATSFGTGLFMLGAVLVGAAHLLHVATGEPPQTTPGPSSFGGRPRLPGAVMPPANPLVVPAQGPPYVTGPEVASGPPVEPPRPPPPPSPPDGSAF